MLIKHWMLVEHGTVALSFGATQSLVQEAYPQICFPAQPRMGCIEMIVFPLHASHAVHNPVDEFGAQYFCSLFLNNSPLGLGPSSLEHSYPTKNTPHRFSYFFFADFSWCLYPFDGSETQNCCTSFLDHSALGLGSLFPGHPLRYKQERFASNCLCFSHQVSTPFDLYGTRTFRTLFPCYRSRRVFA